MCDAARPMTVDTLGRRAWFTVHTSECADGHANCSAWAAHGECGSNAVYMRKECRASCGGCDAATHGTRQPRLGRAHACRYDNYGALPRLPPHAPPSPNPRAPPLPQRTRSSTRW